MTDVIELDDGGRIDRASQKILMALNSSEWTHTGALRKSAELSQNSQVLYRLEEYLVPSGLVEEQKRRTEQDTRRFRITRSGEMWMDDHHEEMITPATRAETQEMASQAVEQANSAKESVQSYRKKVHRLKNAVGDGFDDVEDDLDRYHSRLQTVEGRSHSTKRDLSDVSDSVGEVRDRVDELEEHQEASVNQIGSRLDEQSSEIDALREEIAELREENERLRLRVCELERGPIERLQRWLRRAHRIATDSMTPHSG